MIEHFQMRMVDSHMLAPTVRHLAFERVDGELFAFQPGQFVQVHFPLADGTPVRRSFSIASIGQARDTAVRRMELAVSYVEGGAATRLFAAMQAGEEVETSGPFGRFCLQDKDDKPRYLLIATGTGVAPYRAMLPQIERLMSEEGRRFVLLQGARNAGELLYGEEFAAFARSHDGFLYHPCLSRAARAQPRPEDRPGHVQDMFDEIRPDPDTDIVYLCGNPDMVDDAFAELKQRGLSVRQIRREKYISSR